MSNIIRDVLRTILADSKPCKQCGGANSIVLLLGLELLGEEIEEQLFYKESIDNSILPQTIYLGNKDGDRLIEIDGDGCRIDKIVIVCQHCGLELPTLATAQDVGFTVGELVKRSIERWNKPPVTEAWDEYEVKGLLKKYENPKEPSPEPPDFIVPESTKVYKQDHVDIDIRSPELAMKELL